jgi:hypothetical protein
MTAMDLYDLLTKAGVADYCEMDMERGEKA